MSQGEKRPAPTLDGHTDEDEGRQKRRHMQDESVSTDPSGSRAGSAGAGVQPAMPPAPSEVILQQAAASSDASQQQAAAVSSMPGPQVAPPQAAMPPSAPRIPPGWLDTPAMGTPIGQFIPIKVPLGHRYDDYIAEEKQFTPGLALSILRDKGLEIGMVLDLTKSYAYYDTEEFQARGVGHHKVAMRGRGAVPEPELINHVCWLVYNYLTDEYLRHKHILVHCTHGFNRTGYVIASVMLRLQMGVSVAQAIDQFRRHRPPGIYKEDYVQGLFDYYHELRPAAMKPPDKPPWKDEDEDPVPAEETVPEEETQFPAPMAHDDVIGEAIDDDETKHVQALVMQMIMGPDHPPERLFFPGSQPVSLARSNIDMLKNQTYRVTWKADGTRYMLLLVKWACYIIDRSFRVRRVQLRCPLRSDSNKRHHQTLLDGEMVVDFDKAQNKYRRRYLAYDLMVLNGAVITQKPFDARKDLLNAEVIRPRDKERATSKVHLYQDEAFGLRFKEFWTMDKVEQLLHKFIPQLTHESDGLIFQPALDAYKPATCEELLKWKFADMNSVDFLLRQTQSGGFQLCLMHNRRGNAPSMEPLPDASVVFPEGHQPSEYVNRVIECSWDKDQSAWKYMRHRLDKEYPNAYRVYEKVLQSIKDDINERELVSLVQPPNH